MAEEGDPIRAGLVLVPDPVGRDMVGGTCISGEQLSRNIRQSIALIAIAILATIILLEWALGTLILKRRANSTPGA